MVKTVYMYKKWYYRIITLAIFDNLTLSERHYLLVKDLPVREIYVSQWYVALSKYTK
jgi:hypothetical protein